MSVKVFKYYHGFCCDWVRHSDHLAAIRELTDRLAMAERELERERMRLAACGVVANANTRESAKRRRECNPDYESASKRDVERAVDREMDLRDRLAVVEKERDQWKEYADRCNDDIAFLKNERDELKRNLKHEIEIGAMYCKELDDMKRGKSCAGCESFDPLGGYTDGADSPCIGCSRFEPRDNFKPRDPSSAQGELNETV